MSLSTRVTSKSAFNASIEAVESIVVTSAHIITSGGDTVVNTLNYLNQQVQAELDAAPTYIKDRMLSNALDKLEELEAHQPEITANIHIKNAYNARLLNMEAEVTRLLS
jgi:hypothetical protein